MSDYYHEISASILSADFSRLGEEISSVIDAGSNRIHIDVMDNHYVPNLTIGPSLFKSLMPYVTVPLDIHLMVSCADSMIVACRDLKVNTISIHPESTYHLNRSLCLIREQGAKSGVVLNPSTPLTILSEILPFIDTIVLMSVNPGFGGQQFIPHIFDKISRVRAICDNYYFLSAHRIMIEVDGGVNLSNIHNVASAGANIFVMGSGIYGTDNYVQTIKNIRSILRESIPPS